MGRRAASGESPRVTGPEAPTESQGIDQAPAVIHAAPRTRSPRVASRASI